MEDTANQWVRDLTMESNDDTFLLFRPISVSRDVAPDV
jgi:hypothetical protein